MGSSFNFFIVLLVISNINFSKVNAITSNVVQEFETHEVVPDVIPTAPAASVTVIYPSGVEVELGIELTRIQVTDAPFVSWEASPVKYYTLAFIDADAPSRTNATYRSLLHWLIGNIPGMNLAAGEMYAEYIGSQPPEGSGLHRYIFLVYEQPSRLIFSEPYIPNNSTLERRNFSVVDFAAKYNLGNPIAGNFFQVKYNAQ